MRDYIEARIEVPFPLDAPGMVKEARQAVHAAWRAAEQAAAEEGLRLAIVWPPLLRFSAHQHARWLCTGAYDVLFPVVPV